MRHSYYLALSVFMLACSSGDFSAESAQDSGISGDSASESSSDVESQDVSAGDTSLDQSADTGADSGEPDTSVADSSADTTFVDSSADTTLVESGQPDTGAPDTGSKDTGTTDTGNADTGHSDATICPAPSSDATFDASGLTCAELTVGYAAAVQSAKSCGCSKDCSVTICDSICCTCSVGVNPGRDSFPKAKAILAEWKARVAAETCKPPICPSYACPTPSTFVCSGGLLCVGQQ